MVLWVVFLSAFLAGSIAPTASEGVLVWAIVVEEAPIVLAVLFATIGNTFGGWTNYLIGCLGRAIVRRRGVTRQKNSNAKKNSRAYDIASKWLARYGPLALLFTWLPLVGDLLCLIAGSTGVRWSVFLILSGLGRSLRYLTIALIVA